MDCFINHRNTKIIPSIKPIKVNKQNLDRTTAAWWGSVVFIIKTEKNVKSAQQKQENMHKRYS